MKTISTFKNGHTSEEYQLCDPTVDAKLEALKDDLAKSIKRKQNSIDNDLLSPYKNITTAINDIYIRLGQLSSDITGKIYEGDVTLTIRETQNTPTIQNLNTQIEIGTYNCVGEVNADASFGEIFSLPSIVVIKAGTVFPSSSDIIYQSRENILGIYSINSQFSVSEAAQIAIYSWTPDYMRYLIEEHIVEGEDALRAGEMPISNFQIYKVVE